MGLAVEREAFARAWRFLSYKPLAKWAALIAAVATAVLYVSAGEFGDQSYEEATLW